MLTWQQNSIKASFRGWGEGQDFQLEFPMSFMLVYIVEYLKLFYREIFPLFFFAFASVRMSLKILPRKIVEISKDVKAMNNFFASTKERETERW